MENTVFKHFSLIVVSTAILLLSACSSQINSSSLLSQSSPEKVNRVLFVSNQDGDREIYLTDLQGKNFAQLTHNDRDDYDASWSPDGRYILFTSSRDNGNSEIYVMDADGSNQVNLTQSIAVDTEAKWSPDGEHIAFISDREGQMGLFVMSKDGSDVKNLSQQKDEWAAYGNPSWSPDGQWIAYRKFNQNIKADLWLVNTKSTEHKQLNNNPKHHDGKVSWSPDSNLLVYDSRRSKEFNIYQYNIKSNREDKLTHLPSSDSQPRWSNQGKEIVFLSTRGPSGRTQVFTMKKDGTQQKGITDNRFQVDDVSWLNDDSGILYVSWQNGRVSNVFLADLVTGKQVAIAPAKGYQSQPMLEPAVLSTIFSNQVSLSPYK